MEKDNWRFGDFDSPAKFVCMARVSFDLDRHKSNTLLQTAWAKLIEFGCCRAGKRYSWRSFLVISNSEDLAAHILQILAEVGCEWIAFSICPLDESMDKAIMILESDLLDHNSYWAGLKDVSRTRTPKRANAR